MFKSQTSLISVADVENNFALGTEWGKNGVINATILIIRIYDNRNFAIGMTPEGAEMFFTSYHPALGNPKWRKILGVEI